jgi:uncharacterized protein (TIGR02246 family)
MRAETRERGRYEWAGRWAAITASLLAAGVAVAADPEVEVRDAAAAYAKAFNTSDFAALADQWTERATLAEGGLQLEGRAAIMASLRSWRERHPQATLAIEVQEVDLLAEPLARVAGVLKFTPQPGAREVASRFTSLRVREGSTWRLAESVVVAEHSTALDELDWLVGTWTAESGRREDGGKTSIETIYEKPLGPYCIVGRSRIRPADGDPIEALEVIHADRGTGLIRTWVFDSTGAQGEGIIESDGATYHKSMVGSPSDRVPGRVARWTQVLSPAGDSRCTMHSIERSIDGVAMPDAEPLHFRKVR